MDASATCGRWQETFRWEMWGDHDVHADPRTSEPEKNPKLGTRRVQLMTAEVQGFK